jgi:hypothetical protein
MKVSSSKQIKLLSLYIFVLAILFFAFFDKSKHTPLIAQVNPFTVDPYDAVGSFGIQFVSFIALLTMMRAFRRYQSNGILYDQEKLILRCELMAVLAVAVVLVGDTIGMLRQPSLWINSYGGWILALTLAGMIGLTVLTGWMIIRNSASQIGDGSWKPAMIICPACILILVIYPPAWDEGIFGGISTAVVGMLLFFLSVWALSKGISQESELQAEDLIDDLAAIYSWIKNCAGFPGWVFQKIEIIGLTTQVRSMIDWLNPRKHVWNFIILTAVAAGMALAVVETIFEGITSIPGRAVIVMSVFIFIEAAGVLLAYGLFARFLGIYRSTKSV